MRPSLQRVINAMDTLGWAIIVRLESFQWKVSSGNFPLETLMLAAHSIPSLPCSGLCHQYYIPSLSTLASSSISK